MVVIKIDRKAFRHQVEEIVILEIQPPIQKNGITTTQMDMMHQKT